MGDFSVTGTGQTTSTYEVDWQAIANNYTIEVQRLKARAEKAEADLKAEREKVGRAGDLLLLIYRAFNRFDEAKGVHPAIWHLYASELKPWLDNNRPGWREAEARRALAEIGSKDARPNGREALK